MKRPEDREKPGRKNIYERPTSISLFIPAPLLERIQAAQLDGVNSRNAKLVTLLEQAVSQLESKPSAVA